MHHVSSRDRVKSRDSLALSIEAMEPRRVCAAGLSLSLAQDTGRNANDRITSDATLSISRPLAAGQRVVWGLEFAKPMHVSAVRGVVPGIEFRFRGQDLMARWSGGSGTNRLEYAYVFTAQQAGAGMLEPPTHACLCFGGLITDPAGNKIRKHELPAIAAA